jgi:hypothetical protein
MLILLVIVVGLAEPSLECEWAIEDDASYPLEWHDPAVAPRAERSLADPEGLGGLVLRPSEAVGHHLASWIAARLVERGRERTLRLRHCSSQRR